MRRCLSHSAAFPEVIEVEAEAVGECGLDETSEEVLLMHGAQKSHDELVLSIIR